MASNLHSSPIVVANLVTLGWLIAILVMKFAFREER
jgi:hypothetical protein